MAIAGQPFTRYLDWGPGLLTIEAGIPVADNTGKAALESGRSRRHIAWRMGGHYYARRRLR